MIIQEKEPLSPQRGFKVTAKWSSQKPSKQEEIVVGHGLTTIFLCMQSIDLTAYPRVQSSSIGQILLQKLLHKSRRSN